jgi:hypothetical protein
MYSVYFDFSTGLKSSLNVYEGHFQAILNHVAAVEKGLGLIREDREDNTARWKRNSFEHFSDEGLCMAAMEHNQWVRDLYSYWASKPTGPEVLTPEMASQIWHALTFIRVPPRRWTADYYRDNMERLFDVMVTGARDGITLDVAVLTPAQAAQVVLLFSEFLDTKDIRLTLPHGWDYLVDGEECQWCSKKEINIHDEDGCPHSMQCDDSECLFVLDQEVD